MWVKEWMRVNEISRTSGNMSFIIIIVTHWPKSAAPILRVHRICLRSCCIHCVQIKPAEWFNWARLSLPSMDNILAESREEEGKTILNWSRQESRTTKRLSVKDKIPIAFFIFLLRLVSSVCNFPFILWRQFNEVGSIYVVWSLKWGLGPYLPPPHVKNLDCGNDSS